jgi:putative ABC transport system permease protein
MLKSYFKIAFRNLYKHKGQTILNILSLVIGVISCLLIFQYVAFERSYDSFEPDADRIVRLRLDSYEHGKLSWQSATVYPACGPMLKKDFPEVENYCRLAEEDLLLSNDESNIKFEVDKGYYADPSCLSLFGIQLKEGNTETALKASDKILLSENTAKKYFGNDNPLGKRLVYRTSVFTRDFEVTGVFKEFPINSHLKIKYLISYSTLGNIFKLWGDSTNEAETSFKRGTNGFLTYLKLKPNTTFTNLEAKLPSFCDKYINSRDWNRTNNVRNEIHLIPLRDIHLYSNYRNEAEANGDGQTVSFLFLLSFFIIGIAWINYINLVTARSVERAKEVGLRKVFGAGRSNLIKQFLIESFIINFIAFLFAIGFLYLITPWFNQYIGRIMQNNFSLPVKYWLMVLIMFLSGSLLSGIYPAFVLSGYKPVIVLKGSFKSSDRGILLRKMLIIIQYVTAIILISGTIIVHRQINYMCSQKLGADINETIVLKGAQSVPDSTYQNFYQPFKTGLLKIPAIKNIAASTSIMGKEIFYENNAYRPGNMNKSVTIKLLYVDYDFIPSFDLKILAGRNFSKDFETDRMAILLNEEAAKLLGFTNYTKAINELIVYGNDTVKVIGIVANYHQESLQKTISPIMFWLWPNCNTYYSVKINTSNIPATIAAMKKVWDQHFPQDPFNYFFLDDYFNQQYNADKLYAKVFSLFAIVAISIACFGLLGLSAYNVLQRRKEISVRKTFGASTQSLLFLLSKDFLLLVLLSFIVAIPFSAWMMHYWLQNFAYRITIGACVFVVTGIAVLIIALMTMSFQVIRASLTNPAESLRSE